MPSHNAKTRAEAILRRIDQGKVEVLAERIDEIDSLRDQVEDLETKKTELESEVDELNEQLAEERKQRAHLEENLRLTRIQ